MTPCPAEVCRANLTEEGASEEEIKDEMAVIFVQKACVLQMMAKEEEALKIYTETLTRKCVPSAVIVYSCDCAALWCYIVCMCVTLCLRR